MSPNGKGAYMKKDSFMSLVSILKVMREQVSELLYAGVEDEILTTIKGVTPLALRELKKQIIEKEEDLLNLNKDDKSKSQQFLTYRDMVKRISLANRNTDDIFLLYCQMGGLVYPFKRLPQFNYNSKIKRLLNYYKDSEPYKHLDIYNKTQFLHPLTPKALATKEHHKGLINEGDFSVHLTVDERIMKFNLISAIHGVDKISKATLLSKELVIYLLNKRKVEILDKLFNSTYQYKSTVPNFKNLYQNTYNFNGVQNIALNPDYFVIYHRNYDKYYQQIGGQKLNPVHLPYDMMQYLTGIDEAKLAEGYYLTTEPNEKPVEWNSTFSSKTFLDNSQVIKSYVSSTEPADKVYLELANLSKQAEFNLQHIPVGREILNLLKENKLANDSVYFLLYSFCLLKGVSLNAVSSYIAPLYISSTGDSIC